MTSKISHYTVHNRRTGKVTTYKSGFRCTPASIAADHAADLSSLDAQGFMAASKQATP
jgi:hypothetical protein